MENCISIKLVSGQSLKSKAVSIKSLTTTIICEKASGKIATPSPSPLLPVRGNRTAYRRIQMAHSSPSVVNSLLDMSWCRLPLVPDPQQLLLQQQQQQLLAKPKRLKQLHFLCSDQLVITVSCVLMFRYTEVLRPFREEDLPIKLPSIRSETLLRAISWMRQHKMEEAAGYYININSNWEKDLLEGNGDLCELMDLIMAALHLGLNVLARHASDYLAERLAAKTDSEMRTMMEISKRMAKDEEKLCSLVD
ncbi:hypothetical protein KR200_006883 [Drosophila serrata]|nr:hypothetical protein KR200_006883 [Drosophila serrata]